MYHLAVRLAWNLVAAGILEQVGPDRVSHTSKSKVYMKNNPMSAMICFAFDDMCVFSNSPLYLSPLFGML